MDIRTQKDNDIFTIMTSGRIDTSAAPKLNECIDKNIPGIRELVIDLQETPYISSAGLRVLLNARKVMQKQGSMKSSMYRAM